MDNLSEVNYLIRVGKKAEAWNLLNQVLTSNPRNEEAWILAYELAKPDARKKIIQKALAYLPNSSRLDILAVRNAISISSGCLWTIVIVAILILVSAIILGNNRSTQTARIPTATPDSRKFVTEAQFGEQWPLTVPSGRIYCLAGSVIVIETARGTYGVNGTAASQGYVLLRESPIWKQTAPGHWVSLSDLTSYAVDLCFN